MHPTIYYGRCSLGGGADGVSFDTVLCIGVFHFCGTNGTFVRVFVVELFDSICGSERARTLSDEGPRYSFRFDGGAKSKIYTEAYSTFFRFSCDVGDSDVAAYNLRPCDEEFRMDRRDTICADMSPRDDLLYGRLYNDIYVFVLSFYVGV